MEKIAPCLWFESRAEEAASFYVSLLPDSRIEKVVRAPADYPGGSAGAVLTVEFTLAGRPFVGLNGGAHFPFTEAVSLMMNCDDQTEVDRLWDALTADGGAPVQCGWLKDRYGLSWQIVPRALIEMMADPDRERAGRVMQAMMRMIKIDIGGLQRAYDGS